MAPAHRRQAPKRTFIDRYKSTIILTALGAGVVAIIAAALILSNGGGSASGGTQALAADPALVQTVTSVPQSALDTIGAASGVTSPVKAGASNPLTKDGKPEVLYIGAEYCPYCAAERWPLIVALSRFGTFSGLKTTRSSPTDVYANTATFSFDGSTYQSDVLSFVPVEAFSNQRSGNGYARLQNLTADQDALLNAAGGGFPYLNIGGAYQVDGASYNPGILAGLDWSAIAAQLTQTGSKPSQAILGTANALTAAICKVTNGNPASVCNASGVQAAAATLK
ncbi:MAG TPA: DUF929 family protein [Dehalococcoidia bacterium]|nr:DUF929 family protein [Dehalococcoidia bacterium]